MKLIGFANKFYTLWSYSEEPLYRTINNEHYQYGIKQNYNYIKNISFDLDKVKELYPDVSIDDDLRGKSQSWSNEPRFEYPAKFFHFGRYEGKLISECTEQPYLIWYFENGVYGERHDITKTRLIELGCGFYEDTVFSSVELLNEYVERIANQVERSKMISETYEKYKTPGIFSYTFYHSLNSSGNYVDSSFDFHFNEYSEQYYAGYNFGLPLMNGKAKRIKNKVIEMEVVAVENGIFSDNFFKVLSIKFIKNI